MSVQRIHALTLLACAAVALAAVVLWKPARREPPRLSALAAIPSGARFAATLDLTELRKSGLGSALLAEGRELPGVGRLESVCGFDPAASVSEVALATPARDAGTEPELGIVVSGDFGAERIGACADAVIRARGGTPARTRVGSFETLRDRGGPAGDVAVRDGGPILLGEGRYLHDMIDTVEGRGHNLRQDRLHASLRAAVGDGGAVVASWSLPEDWLERLTGDPLARLSPLAAVRAAALRVDVAPEISAHAVLACAAGEICQEVADVLANLSRDFGPVLREELGADPLEGARIELVDGSVHVRVSLGERRASTIARKLMGRWMQPPAPAQPPPDAVSSSNAGTPPAPPTASAP